MAGRGAKDATVYALLGSAYFMLHDYSEATTQYQKAAKLNPPHEETIQTKLALSYLAAGSPGKAIPILETASNLSSSFVGADYLLATTYLSHGKLAKARQWARHLIEKQPKNPVAYNVIGASYRAQKDPDKARQFFLQALEIDPGYVTAAMNLAQLDLAQGKTAEARKRYQQILDKHPRSSAALLALARLSLREKKPAEAIKLLTRAREADASAVAPRLMLARYYLGMGRWTDALENATGAYHIAPNDTRVLMALGTSQLAGNRAKDALSSFRALEKLRPNKPGPSYSVAMAQAKLGDLAGARRTLQRALRIKPDHLLANVALAQLEIRTGHPESAIPIAEKLIKRFRNRVPDTVYVARRGLPRKMPQMRPRLSRPRSSAHPTRRWRNGCTRRATWQAMAPARNADCAPGWKNILRIRILTCCSAIRWTRTVVMSMPSMHTSKR